jgi:hypothetical protein
MNLKLYGIIVALCAALGVCLYFLVDARKERNNNAAIITQNTAAYESQLHQKDSNNLVLSAKVNDLNSKVSHLEKEKGYWILTSQQLQAKIDSSKGSGQGIASNGTDSLGQYCGVAFNGKQGITSFKGDTKYYSNGVKPQWNLALEYDIIPISNSLYRDTDGLWKFRTTTESPGVKFSSNSEVDSTLYIAVRQGGVDNEIVLPSFGLRLELTGRLNLENNLVQLNPTAGIFYKYYMIEYSPLDKTVIGGVYWVFDAGKFLSKLL